MYSFEILLSSCWNFNKLKIYQMYLKSRKMDAYGHETRSSHNHGGIIKEMLCGVQHWSHKRGQHWGGPQLRKSLTLIYCIFIACLVLAHGPQNTLILLTLAYSRVLTWVVDALLTTQAEGLEVSWLVEGLEVCWLHLLLWWNSVGAAPS